MAQKYESVFIGHLTTDDGIRAAIPFNVTADMLPTEDVRRIYQFILDYFEEGGAAPTEAVLRHHFDAELKEHEIDLVYEVEETIEWAVRAIRNAWINSHAQGWAKELVTEVMSKDDLEKVEAFDTGLQRLMKVSAQITSKSIQMDMREAMDESLALYEERRRLREIGGSFGAVLGLPEVDLHVGGIRPGELGILAAGPKTGKSFFLANSAWHHWRLGGTPVLFTLENSVAMTVDRLACMFGGVDTRRWQRGECAPEEIAQINEWRRILSDPEHHPHPFWIVQPEPGRRTMEHMIRLAKSLGDYVLIDQLTFVDVIKGTERKPRHEQIRDMLHDAKSIITSGQRIPCLLAHQINREGVKAAEKSGRLEMYHMAEAAEVERTADWAWGLWQSRSLRENGQAWLQSLAARREDLIHWEMIWRPYMGEIIMQRQITVDDE